jgi:hypothetical protein
VLWHYMLSLVQSRSGSCCNRAGVGAIQVLVEVGPGKWVSYGSVASLFGR